MNEQLTSDELRQVLAEWIRPMYPKERQKIAGLFEAVIARAEAAEALAAERLEDALFAEQRATDAELERDDAILAASDADRGAEDTLLALSHFRARVAELEAQVASHRRDYNNLYDDYHEMRHKLADIGAMLRAARQRVAELESQLAAQQWRPVTEDWPPYGVQHLGRAGLDSPTLLVTRVLFESDMVWLWQDNDGLLLYGDDIRYCAAIPPLSAPQETTP
jgi:hypothetical protein